MAHRISVSRPAQNDLEEHPMLYPATDFRGKPRRVNVFEYALFYEPLADDGIFVLRIIHGKRNLGAILGVAK